MKKFLRFLIILIVVVAAIFLVLAVVEPTDIPVSRSILIKAPKDSVFEQIVKLKNWVNWNPWYKMEPTMKMTYSGADGQPGSSYHWVGDDKKTGEGEVKNTSVNGTEMDFDMAMIKPREGSAHGNFVAADTAGMTKVTWNFTMHMPFPLNAMNVFMNMDKMLGGDFENGLGNMKQYVESHTAPAPAIEIKEVDYPAQVFEGTRKTVYWTDLQKFFSDAYDIVAKDVAGNINGHQVGIFYTWDTVNKQADLFVGFPVTDTTNPVKGTIFTYVGPGKAVLAVEKGPYSGAMQYHTALGKYMTAKGMTPALKLEEYVTCPKQDPDSTKWVTKMYYREQ
jgi:hypothetical protein